MTQARRLAARDYKNPRGRSLTAGRWRDFGGGLTVGLVIGLGAALAVFVSDRRTLAETAGQARPAPQQAADAAADATAESEEPAAQYDFYEMLPKFEVVVPEKDREVRRDLPSVPVEAPGVYVLQAGSYRNLADADRVRVQLERQRIDARVERVAVDADVWHRVRIGPIRNLAEVNRVRDLLRKADINPLVIKVAD
jgi:cell division protein FtsN